MKHYFFILTAILIGNLCNAQFEISASGGYTISSAGIKLGEIVTATETKNAYGSYGEGANVQIRGTYFINDTFGFDVALGYLQGADKDLSVVTLPNTEVNAIARARAFGASAGIVYKFTNNIYGRFGALIKVGGKTEGVVYQKSVFSEAEANALNLPEGSYSETNFKEDFYGHFPLGLVAALGYKHDLNSNFSVFIEAEYYGISLKRKSSELAAFNTDVFLPDGTVAVKGLYTLDNLPEGVYKETNYVDNISNTNTDGTIELSQKVPYSSFGLNLGVVYKFKRAKKE